MSAPFNQLTSIFNKKLSLSMWSKQSSNFDRTMESVAKSALIGPYIFAKLQSRSSLISPMSAQSSKKASSTSSNLLPSSMSEAEQGKTEGVWKNVKGGGEYK